MATTFSIRLRGVRRVAQALDALARRNPRVAFRAMNTEAEVEMLEMKERTPVDIDTLRPSGRVERTGPLAIRWVFGGAAIDYAVAVHEDLEAFHNPGQAKYMESVVNEFIPNAAERIGRRWASEMGL